MQGGASKDAALDRMSQVVLCNRRRVRPLWGAFFARVASMAGYPSAHVRAAAAATLKRTVLALLATRDSEAGPMEGSDGVTSGGPSAKASGALMPLPGAC